MELNNFVAITDQKSLSNKIREVVKYALRYNKMELHERRLKLSELLEREEKAYEAEYLELEKNRKIKNLQDRKKTLELHQQQLNKERHVFLEKKKIQRAILSCDEIRTKFSERLNYETKKIQEEQILENQRKIGRARELEKMWIEVRERQTCQFDKQQRQEECLKKRMQKYNEAVWRLQLEDHEILAEKRRQEELQDFRKTREHMNVLRLEEFDAKVRKIIDPKKLQLQKELLEQDKEVKARLRAQKCDMDNYAINLRNRLERETMDENEAIRKRKRTLYKEAMSYICYLKQMRWLEEQRNKYTAMSIDKVEEIDFCTKKNVRLEKERKQQALKDTIRDIKQQILDMYNRRMKEEMERLEDKMLINVFSRPDPTREEILKQQEIRRRELDRQVEDIKAYRQKEIEDHEAKLLKAEFDPSICDELAEKYLREGIDYLEPHENWLIMSCVHDNVWEQKQRKEPYKCTEMEIQPCGCEGRGMVSKCGERKVYEMIQ